LEKKPEKKGDVDMDEEEEPDQGEEVV